MNNKECKNMLECIDYLEENVSYWVYVGAIYIGTIQRVTNISECVTYQYPDSFVDSYNIVGFENTKHFFHDIPVVLYKKEREIYLKSITDYAGLFAYDFEDNYDIFSIKELENWEE